MSRQPEVVVVVPTVDGREEHLDRCMVAYTETLDGVFHHVEVIHNMATCGAAWNRGAEVARLVGARYVHMTADDLEPQPGWYEAAVQCVEYYHASPAALIYNGITGELESHGDWAARYDVPTPVSMCRIPFCRTEQWIDIPPIHYFSDNAFSSAMQMQGLALLAVPGMAFKHYWASAGRHPMGDQQWNDEQRAWHTWALAEQERRAPRWT